MNTLLCHFTLQKPSFVCRDYKNGYDICVMVTAKPFDKDKMQGRTLTLTNSTAYQKDQSVVGRVQSAGKSRGLLLTMEV